MNLLQPDVVKYLVLVCFIPLSQSAFLIKLLTLGILFSTTVRAVVAAKPLILGILP